MYGITPSLSCSPTWKSHMCGVCYQLRTDGLASAAVNNDDAVLLSLLIDDLRGGVAEQRHVGPCPLRKFQSAEIVVEGSDSVRFAAGVAEYMASQLIADRRIDDESWWRNAPGVRSFGDRLATDGRAHLTAFGLDVDVLDHEIARHHEIEQVADGLDLEDRLAPIGRLYGRVTRHIATIVDRPDLADALERLGTALGRLTLLLDARDDVAADERSGRSNPLTQTEPDPERRETLAAQVIASEGARLHHATEELGLPRDSVARRALQRLVQRRTGAPEHALSAAVAPLLAGALIPVVIAASWSDLPATGAPGMPMGGNVGRRKIRGCGCCDSCDCGCCCAEACGDAAGDAACDGCCDACDCCDCCDC